MLIQRSQTLKSTYYSAHLHKIHKDAKLTYGVESQEGVFPWEGCHFGAKWESSRGMVMFCFWLYRYGQFVKIHLFTSVYMLQNKKFEKRTIFISLCLSPFKLR